MIGTAVSVGLAHLDAEITALRNALGMGTEPQPTISSLTLRTEQAALEQRAFRTSDAMRTQGRQSDGQR